MARKINFKLIKKSSKAVLFLHGLGGDLGIWRFMEKPVIKRNLSFFAIDIPGHGLSRRLNTSYKIDDIVEKIVVLLNENRFKKVVIVGHCFGGMLALELGLKLHNKIDKLILICTSYKLLFWAKIINYLLSIAKSLPIGPKFEHVDFSRYKHTGDLNCKRLYSDISHVGIKSYSYLFNSLVDWNIKDRLDEIRVKTIIIAGKKDTIYPPAMQLRMNLAIPKSKLKWVKANHIAPVSKQKEIKNLIISCLKS